MTVLDIYNCVYGFRECHVQANNDQWRRLFFRWQVWLVCLTSHLLAGMVPYHRVVVWYHDDV